jgi:hypothetical protein
MARYGFLICRDCREHIFLGKWLRTDEDVGLGFWHGTLCGADEPDSALLGRKVLRFVARHMDHELLAASDEGGRADHVLDSDEYISADEVYDSVAQASRPQKP